MLLMNMYRGVTVLSVMAASLKFHLGVRNLSRRRGEDVRGILKTIKSVSILYKSN